MSGRRLAIACALLAAACGARTGLVMAGTQGGAAGAGGAGGGGAGGAPGGSGGSAGGEGGFCSALVQTGEVVVVPGLPGEARSRPRLHALPGGPVVVFHRSVPGAGGGSDEGLAATFVDWLGEWPPAFGAPTKVSTTAGWTFALDREPAPFAGVIAGSSSTPPGIAYGLVDAGAGGVFSPSVETAASGTEALSVRFGTYRYFVAMQAPGPFVGGPSFHLLGGWVHQPPNGIQYEGPYVLGCVDRPSALQGVETADGWVVAQAVPYGGACADDVGPSPPVGVTTYRFAEDGTAYFGLTQPVSTTVADLVLSPREGGAWLTWGVDGAPGEPPRLEAMALDSLGLAATAPVVISPEGSAPYSFDAAGFAGALVAAFEDDPANNPPDLRVVLADGSGVLSTEVIENPPFIGEVRLHADSANGSILVAFSGPAMETGTAIYLARFGCLP
jgi:hypothetical protein